MSRKQVAVWGLLAVTILGPGCEVETDSQVANACEGGPMMLQHVDDRDALALLAGANSYLRVSYNNSWPTMKTANDVATVVEHASGPGGRGFLLAVLSGGKGAVWELPIEAIPTSASSPDASRHVKLSYDDGLGGTRCQDIAIGDDGQTLMAVLDPTYRECGTTAVLTPGVDDDCSSGAPADEQGNSLGYEYTTPMPMPDGTNFTGLELSQAIYWYSRGIRIFEDKQGSMGHSQKLTLTHFDGYASVFVMGDPQLEFSNRRYLLTRITKNDCAGGKVGCNTLQTWVGTLEPTEPTRVQQLTEEQLMLTYKGPGALNEGEEQHCSVVAISTQGNDSYATTFPVSCAGADR